MILKLPTIGDRFLGKNSDGGEFYIEVLNRETGIKNYEGYKIHYINGKLERYFTIFDASFRQYFSDYITKKL